MKINHRSTILALLAALFIAGPAAAAGTVQSVGFQCTNDPRYKVWFHSYAHAPQPVAQADATALAQRVCSQINGAPVNAKVNYSDGSHVAVSPTADLPANLPPVAAAAAPK
jgi:hypothetical protein